VCFGGGGGGGGVGWGVGGEVVCEDGLVCGEVVLWGGGGGWILLGGGDGVSSVNPLLLLLRVPLQNEELGLLQKAAPGIKEEAHRDGEAGLLCDSRGTLL